jgi:hypothetical protein
VSKPLCNFLHPPGTGFLASRSLYFLSEFVPSFMFAFLKLNHSSFLYLTGTFIHISIRKTPKVILCLCVCVCVCVCARARARVRRVEQILKHVVLPFYCVHFFILHAIYFVFVIDNFTLMLYSIVCLNLVSVYFCTLYFI